MRHGRSLFWISLLCAFAMLSGTSLAMPRAAEQVTATPTTSGGTPTANLTFGPGSFNLHPLTGLADLKGYQATLSIDFKGKEGGKNNPWNEKFVLLVSSEPAVRALTATFKGKAPAAAYVPPWSATKDGIFYQTASDKACFGSVLADPDPNGLRPVWEPADFLPGVIGAEEVGAKKVNSIDAKGYKFDERALGVAGLAKATGEVWVAETGGYVLKYTLKVTGGPEYFGEGGEGSMTWAYDVTKVGQSAAIKLPKDCPTGLVDAPVMEDAQDVQRYLGATVYTTKSTVAQVADYYQKTLTEAGWTAEGTPIITEKIALLSFKQGTSKLIVFVKAGEIGTSVRLQG